MSKYEANTRKKKEKIINAALRLFQDKGFAHVTVKQIAAAAQVSQVTIYNYYGSKEALFGQCIHSILRDTLLHAREILELDISFPEKIKRAFGSCSTDITVAISNQFSKAAFEDPAFKNLLLESINQSKSAIYREYIEYGKREGAIHTHLSTETVLDFLEALNTHGSTKEADPKELEQLYDLLLYGLIGKPGPSQ